MYASTHMHAFNGFSWAWIRFGNTLAVTKTPRAAYCGFQLDLLKMKVARRVTPCHGKTASSAQCGA
jgi:hypothetical protein